MPQLHARPPTRVLSSRAVSNADAQNLLSTYILASESSAALHPDADLLPEGPQFSTHGSKGGITLHLLRRVEQGLRGEILAPEPKSQSSQYDDAQVPETPPRQRVKRTDNPRKRELLEENDVDWEDPDAYRKEQEDAEDTMAEQSDFVETESRTNVVGIVEDVPDVTDTNMGSDVDELSTMNAQPAANRKAFKNQRKAEKLKRRQAEKKEKIKARRLEEV